MPPASTPNLEYQSIAPWYDRIIVPLLQPEYRLAERYARQLNPDTTVDLCCGTGALAIRLARQGFQITGVDLSRDMLQQARNQYVPGTTFLRSDAAWTGLSSDHFDLAIISMALHEKPAFLREQIIAEAKRLLTPNGHLLLMDYAVPTTFTARAMHRFAGIIERMAGKEHHGHYQSFLAAGGLDTLIHNNDLTLQRTTFLHHDLIQISLTNAGGNTYSI